MFAQFGFDTGEKLPFIACKRCAAKFENSWNQHTLCRLKMAGYVSKHLS